VHDVRVALDAHDLGDLDGAGGGHAPDVVAPEVDEHDVLARSWDREELARSCASSSGVAAARAGPASGRTSILPWSSRTRNSGEAPVTRLRGSRGEHVRRRVGHAQRAVDVEDRRRRGHLEALRQHDLERVAGVDYSLACAPGQELDLPKVEPAAHRLLGPAAAAAAAAPRRGQAHRQASTRATAAS